VAERISYTHQTHPAMRGAQESAGRQVFAREALSMASSAYVAAPVRAGEASG